MKVSELVASIRIAVDDTNATVYSDYSVLDVTNSVFANVANFLNKHNSSLLMKEVRVVLEDNIAKLPDDFVCMVSVTDDDENDIRETNRLSEKGYKIVGTDIKSKLPYLNIKYSSCFVSKVGLDSDVPFPMFFNEYLKKYIVMVLTNNNSDASISILPVIEADLIELVSNREHADIERPMQFRV